MVEQISLITEQIPHLRRYAAALLADRDNADDLVQECLARAISRHHLWKPTGTVRTWLFTILHNLHVNQIRDQKRKPEFLSDPVGYEQHGELPRQENRLEVRDLQRALQKLPDDQRAVLLLVGLEGHSYAEVALIVDAPIGTVMSRLARARDGLRKIMASQSATDLKVVK
ncbi:MAG: RNA polymerase sigma factor [Rhodospirillales bacterium]|nr:RNA polymerase sigma factor [Rhodospirillales bacterium]